MPFTVPNTTAAFNAHQALLNSVDFDVITAGISGQNGVSNGCVVTTTGAANGSVTVATGVVLVNGVYVNVAAGNQAITTNSSGNPRIDLITVDTIGSKFAVAGTPGAVPLLPTVPAGRTVLAAVYVPNGHTTTSTIAAGQVTDKRVLTPTSDFEAHNVLQYGAIGNSHHNTAGGADDTVAIQAAYEAAQAAGGFGVVVFPGNRTYRITDTIETRPDPTLASAWTWGVGSMGGSRSIGLPNIVWDGATDGVMLNNNSSGQNLGSALFRNVRLAGRNVAGTAIRMGPTDPGNPAHQAKLDSGTGLDEVWIASVRGNGVSAEGTGSTNFWIRGGRWDAIGGYAVYMRVVSHTHLSIRDVTWDNNNPPSGTTPMGFLHLDGSGLASNAYAMLRLDTIHTEVQVNLAETDATGVNAADRRGLYQFTINPAIPQLQFEVVADSLQCTGHTGSHASYSIFQLLGGTAAQRTARFMLHARDLKGTGGTGADATGDFIPIGNITAAKYPHALANLPGYTIAPGRYGEIKFGIGGDDLTADFRPGWSTVIT